jgi:hypothetical protein
MDIDEKLSECEKYRNLCWLRKLLEEIEDYEPGMGTPTDKLIGELVEFFHEIREVFPNFNTVANPTNNPDINESKSIAEEMAQLLETDAPWEDDDTISVFKRFLTAVDALVQGTCDFAEMEIDDLLSNLTIPASIK